MQYEIGVAEIIGAVAARGTKKDKAGREQTGEIRGRGSRLILDRRTTADHGEDTTASRADDVHGGTVCGIMVRVQLLLFSRLLSYGRGTR